MARSPLGLLKRVTGSRHSTSRSLGAASSALSYLQGLKQGSVPGPLLLAIRAANQLAERILEEPVPMPTPLQRLTLLAAGAQLRVMTSHIIVSAEGQDPHGTEAELAALIRRTLALIERVTAEAPALDARSVIDTELWVVPPATSEPKLEPK